MDEQLEEHIVIDVSMEVLEEAGANGRSPSPEYEDLKEAELLMEQAGTAGAPAWDRIPEYRAPGSRSLSRGQRERSPVHKSYYTEDSEPRRTVRGKEAGQGGVKDPGKDEVSSHQGGQ